MASVNDVQAKEMLLVTLETAVRRLLLGSNIICESKELPTTASRFTFRRTTSRLASVLRGWYHLCESTNLLETGVFHLVNAVSDLCTSIIIPEVLRRFIEFIEEEGRQGPNRSRKDTNPHLNHQPHLPWARRCQDLLELRRTLLILHIRLRRLRREALRALSSKSTKDIPSIKGQDIHQDFLDDSADLLDFSSPTSSPSSSPNTANFSASPTLNEDNSNYAPAAVVWIDPEIGRDGLIAGDSFEETDDAALNNKCDYVREEEYHMLIRNSRFSIELGIITAQLDQDYGSSDNGVIILPVSSADELAAMLKRSKERKGVNIRDPFGIAAGRGSLRVVVAVKPSTMYYSQPSYAPGFKLTSSATIASAASFTPCSSPSLSVSSAVSLSIPGPGKRKSMVTTSRGKKDLKRTLLWLSDGDISSEQKLLFSRAKVEHIQVVRMKSTSEFLSWMELEYNNRVKGEVDYVVEVRLAMVPNRGADPGIPELGIDGGSNAGSSLALWIKKHENPWWRSLPILIFCEKDAPCQCTSEPAKWLFVTSDLSEAADYCCMNNVLPIMEFEAFWSTSIRALDPPPPPSLTSNTTSFCTSFVGLIGMADYLHDAEDIRLLSPELDVAPEVKASLEVLEKYGLKSVPILAYMGKGQTRGLGVAGKNTPSVRPTRDPFTLFNFVNMSIPAWVGPPVTTSSLAPTAVKKDKKSRKPAKSDSGVTASIKTRWKSLLLPTSYNPSVGLTTAELPHAFQSSTNPVYYTALGQKVALAQDKEMTMVLVDLRSGKGYEYASDSWTGSPEQKIETLLSSPDKSKVQILTYDEVTIISDTKRWAQVFPPLPFLAGKSIPMQGMATRDYKGSYRLWKVSELTWNTHPRYPMAASQWIEKPKTKYQWGIDQQYTIDIENFSLLHPHTDHSVTKLKYFSPSIRRESYTPTPPQINVNQLVFYQHLLGLIFRERPHEVRVWDTRRFTLLPAGNWNFDKVVESPGEIFVLRHRFPVEHLSIGSSCIVTVTKEAPPSSPSPSPSTSSSTSSSKLISFLVLWNLFGEQITAIPLGDNVISLSINAGAVFVLLPKRVLCISASTGERLGELEMTKEHLGCDPTDWISIHSPSLETLCFFSRNGRILRRDIQPVAAK